MKLSKKAKRILKIFWIAYAIFSIIMWLPQTDRLLCIDYPKTSQHIALDDQWNIQINNTHYNNVSLNELKFPAVEIGDKIIMERRLPDDWDIAQAALRLHIRQTTVNICIDGEQVYEYGFDRYRLNKTVGSGFQFVNFLDEYKGKTMTITLHISEDRAFSRFDSIRLYEWDHAYRALLTENRLPMFLGSFLFVFGLIVASISAIAVLFSTKFLRMLFLAAFSVCMGLWTLCYYNAVLVFSIPLYSISFIEYMALYISPIPILLYMYAHVKDLNDRKFTFSYWILFGIQFIFNIVTIYLHTLDLIHCAATLKYMQTLIILHLIYFSVVLVKNFKKNPFTKKFYLWGLSIVSASIGYDLFAYYYSRYFAGTTTLKGVSSFGIIVFLFVLFLEFYYSLAKKIIEEKERNYLIKSAYTDDLTLLPNRRFCSEHMQKITESKNMNYAVMCFDLNNLKVVNDTYGHTQGDLLIKCAADVLSKSFAEHGVVGRMGGDEFIAILNTSNQKDIDHLIDAFHENIAMKNQEYSDLDLSISCGYTICGEGNIHNIEKLYRIADTRMYENKKQYKERRKAQIPAMQ